MDASVAVKFAALQYIGIDSGSGKFGYGLFKGSNPQTNNLFNTT
jgi:hypothetical protein